MNAAIKKQIHQRIYFVLLIGMAISLPLSKALISIVPFILLLNWLIEGQFQEKWSRIKNNPSIALLPSVFIIYLLELVRTTSLKWGIVDIKIQIPLFILPLVMGTSPILSRKQVKTILQFFVAAIVVSSICSIYALLGFTGKEIIDIRDISLFISHIRFSLLVNIAIFTLSWLIFNKELPASRPEKRTYAIVLSWLIVFLFILKSMTGIVIFMVTLLALALWFSFKVKHVVLRFTIYVFLMMIPLFIGAYLTRSINDFYRIEENTPLELNGKTQQGNPYTNDLNNQQIENGHYVFRFIADDELRDAWNQRSQLNYDSTYAGGFNRFTIFRYLTSKGLKKDAEGLSQLTDQDIHNIEEGIPNYLFANKYSLNNRIYQTIWEFNEYKNGGSPAGSSVVQRIEYFKIACQVISQHFWFGVGTGSYFPAYQKEYDQRPFFHAQKFRQRSHNMFLSYWVDFGLIGLLYIAFAYTYPVFRQKKNKSYLFLTFSLIMLLSFLNEDTLNNHDAIAFFAFFYSLFIFSNHEKREALQ